MKYRSPFWVYISILFSGGLLAFYWPWKISSEFRLANAEHIAAERLEKLASAENHYRLIVIFHIIFWLFLLFLGLEFELPRRPDAFFVVFRIGMLEIVSFYFIVVRLIYTFEKQFVDIGHRPKLWRTILLTLLWFWSVSTMQKLTNLALKQTNPSRPTK